MNRPERVFTTQQIRLERRLPSYWRVTFDLPPLIETAADLCRGQKMRYGSAILMGHVATAQGAPLSGTRVRATWLGEAGSAGGGTGYPNGPVYQLTPRPGANSGCMMRRYSRNSGASISIGIDF